MPTQTVVNRSLLPNIQSEMEMALIKNFSRETKKEKTNDFGRVCGVATSEV